MDTPLAKWKSENLSFIPQSVLSLYDVAISPSGTIIDQLHYHWSYHSLHFVAYYRIDITLQEQNIIQKYSFMALSEIVF